MPRRRAKKRSKRSSTRSRQAPKRGGVASFRLEEDTWYSIVAIGCFIVAALSILSFFDLAGVLGDHFAEFLGLIFGWGSFWVPVILVLAGYLLLNREKKLRTIAYVGIVVFVLSFLGFMHMFFGIDSGEAAFQEGKGGGLVGYFISAPLSVLVGSIAAWIILVALMLVSVLAIFDISIRDLFASLPKRSPKVKENGADADDKKQEEIKVLDNRGELKEKSKGKGQKGKEEEVETEEPKVVDTLEENKEADFKPALEQESLVKNWKLPELDILADDGERPESGDVKASAEIIQKTLQNFGIEVGMSDINIGPTVTQYTLKPSEGVKLNKITALQNDIALALAAHPIRIEAPIPGKALVGIEVPNEAVATVRLRTILSSDAFPLKNAGLEFALGRDVAGTPMIADLAKMPHLLIAGSTGSGKSVCMNSLMTSLLYHNSPNDMRMILVDPKRVEFSYYNDIPHLLTPVITEVDKTVNAFKWVVSEMDRRYKVLAELGARDIKSYNAKMKGAKMPYIVVVVDELADLMATAAQDVESAIVRLAQMARAVGIHLVVATQRPSVDVITGLIKANITNRIAFAVASQTDSRTIIDTSGAEKLLGNGDMLYITPNLSKPKRIQGTLIDEKEVKGVTDFIKKQKEPSYEEEVTEKQTKNGSQSELFNGDDDVVDDDLFAEAKQEVIRMGKGSASLLQRRLRIGYARAARLLDILEEKGVVGPPDGSKPREVLVKGSGEATPEPQDNFQSVDDSGSDYFDDSQNKHF